MFKEGEGVLHKTALRKPLEMVALVMVLAFSLVALCDSGVFGMRVVEAYEPTRGTSASHVSMTMGAGVPLLYLPMIMRAPIVNQGNPRVGFAACTVGRLSSYRDIAQLKAGWYLDYGATATFERPQGAVFVQSVYLHQNTTCGRMIRDRVACPYVTPYTYTVAPSIASIQAMARSVPGSVWLLGTEVDRVDYGRDTRWGHDDVYGPVAPGGHNEMMPELYAQAYRALHDALEEADPTAKVAIASVVQGTPLRIAYLNRVWAEYERLYHTGMPVDVFNVHAFIIKEDCNDHGADVPPGSGDCQGKCCATDRDYCTDLHHINLRLFDEYIRAYRQWMKDHGQQNKPLIVTELGVAYRYDWPPYQGTYYETPQVVVDWLRATFDYMLNTKDSNLGLPADGGRLVQAWAWFSLDGGIEGDKHPSLLNPDGTLSPVGQAFAEWSRTHNAPLPSGLW